MTTQTVQSLLATHNLTTFGYPAIKGLDAHSNPEGTPAVLSAVPAPVIAEAGYNEFYAPVYTGASYGTPEELIAANPAVELFRVEKVESSADPIIVTQHAAAVDLLLESMPHLQGVEVLSRATVEQIAGKHVYGQLPPAMVAAADAYTTVTVPGFDQRTMGDMSAAQLKEAGLEMQIKGAYRVTLIENK